MSATTPTTAISPRSQIAVIGLIINEPKPTAVVKAEMSSGAHTSAARATPRRASHAALAICS